MDGPTEYARGDGYLVSTWRNLMLMLWSGALTREGLDATERAGRVIQRSHPNQQVAISITIPNVPMPDDKARTHAARLLRESSDRVLLSVTVIEGDGFWLSAGRMVITALVSLSGGKSKPIITKSIDEAGPLLLPHLSPKATSSEVMEVLRFFRSDVAPPKS